MGLPWATAKVLMRQKSFLWDLCPSVSELVGVESWKTHHRALKWPLSLTGDSWWPFPDPLTPSFETLPYCIVSSWALPGPASRAALVNC